MADGVNDEKSESKGTYAKLAAPWPKEEVKSDTRGGVTFDYITGEMCITRLNDTFGPAGWSFKILDHRVDADADEVVVLGELSARIWTSYEDGTKQWDTVIKQQWGSQKIRRSRSSGQALDLGFDYKGATTDCLKKCATLYGVALYLTKKLSPEEKHQQLVAEREAAKEEGKPRSAGSTTASATRGGAPKTAPSSSTQQSPSPQTESQSPGSTPASTTSSSTPARSTTDSATKLATSSTEDIGGQQGSPSTVASLTTELERVAETDERPKGDPQVSTESPGPRSTPQTTNGSSAATTTLPDISCAFCGQPLIEQYTVNSKNGPQLITGYTAAERSRRLFGGVVLDPMHGEMLYKMDPKLMSWWKKEHKGKPVTWGQAVPAR